MSDLRFDVVRSVKIDRSRWDVRIVIDTGCDEPVVYVASADSGLTDGDGIYLARLAEFEADCEECR